jgi:hypothetical protein
MPTDQAITQAFAPAAPFQEKNDTDESSSATADQISGGRQWLSRQSPAMVGRQDLASRRGRAEEDSNIRGDVRCGGKQDTTRIPVYCNNIYCYNHISLQ